MIVVINVRGVKKHTHLEKDCWYQPKEEANYSENNNFGEQIFYS